MAHNPWNIPPGLNNVGSFQVSGRPFASGSIVAHASGTAAVVVRFPTVTKWVMIGPHHIAGAHNSLRVAFSENGLHGKGKGADQTAGGYNCNVHRSGSFSYQQLDLKVSELWFMSNGSSTVTFDVLAGLTHIPAASTTTIDRAVTGQYTGTVTEAAGPNWSGSAGVG